MSMRLLEQAPCQGAKALRTSDFVARQALSSFASGHPCPKSYVQGLFGAVRRALPAVFLPDDA
ncbi:MAG: hypothetical protein WBA65_07270 [Rhodanobacter sp.]|jgi:hypothetical protein|nr:hypothetical protein [Rhodanobacter sp.]